MSDWSSGENVAWARARYLFSPVILPARIAQKKNKVFTPIVLAATFELGPPNDTASDSGEIALRFLALYLPFSLPTVEKERAMSGGVERSLQSRLRC